MIESTASVTAVQAARMPQTVSPAVVEPIVPRDPNALVGPRPSFDVTPLERLREARPIDEASIPADGDGQTDTSVEQPVGSAGPDPDVVPADLDPPGKGTAVDIRA
ncbi:hypothetical protein PARPLA_02411 [Rhodobacteraceae bacterium THAF1]|uniref:hypothetical protein n=1 Tax=Palleronia sp. THAF1 TaxID=2587842 RepID=UPI000F3EFEC2|nr:hypothetical protein [Palleronia sp. THAF1]QFU09221.1 hypothetical protein FIU81_11105 [Palleronia sp. THAF1]VDC27347.1 hypothetical protein PARPLA_02411 [Rhodobacteraceae bacterium THAF1]